MWSFYQFCPLLHTQVFKIVSGTQQVLKNCLLNEWVGCISSFSELSLRRTSVVYDDVVMKQEILNIWWPFYCRTWRQWFPAHPSPLPHCIQMQSDHSATGVKSWVWKPTYIWVCSRTTQAWAEQTFEAGSKFFFWLLSAVWFWGRRLDFGWYTHNRIYTRCIIQLHVWNLCNVINQYHPVNLIWKTVQGMTQGMY